ncbi:MAG: hypothetical protein U1E68_00555 [Sphingomonadaceae bacterium]
MSHVPISPTSPCYHFSPEGIGSLARREWMGEWISPEDVQHVVDANPEAGSDARLQYYVERVASGEISVRSARRGRPVNQKLNRFHHWFQIEYEDCRLRIVAGRRDGTLPKRLRSDPSPCFQAAEEVARCYRLGTGHSLLNLFSLKRNQAEKHSERLRAFFLNEKLRSC